MCEPDVNNLDSLFILYKVNRSSILWIKSHVGSVEEVCTEETALFDSLLMIICRMKKVEEICQDRKEIQCWVRTRQSEIEQLCKDSWYLRLIMLSCKEKRVGSIVASMIHMWICLLGNNKYYPLTVEKGGCSHYIQNDCFIHFEFWKWDGTIPPK